WQPMEKATLTGTTQVAAYVNLPNGVGRVAYLLDGVQAASASRLPWVADLSLSGLTGAHTLTVVAYDKAGQEGYRRNYTFDASVIKVKLNGRYIDFDQPPVILDGRTLVPARAILEALGAEISWDAATQTVTAVRNGSVLKLQIGNPVPTKDGKPLEALSVPAQIIGGRTLVPVRFVSENYNMNVAWDQEAQTVIITAK
ncbi:MAG TPA: stalk domain-containing protein, partial [Symbiobacteriaceae bacterium]|nr:stalk domain-containing protein [Symbiobacteriaceae bacterium]